MPQVYGADKKHINFSRTFMNIVLLIVISFLIITFILNAVFLDPLFMMGVNFIEDMQKGFDSPVFAVFMNIFSLICNTPIIAVIFLLEMGLTKQKLKAIIHLSFFLLGFHITPILKLAYQQTRPVWVSYEIKQWEWFCPTDFGNPSGHSYVAFPLFQPLIVKFIGFERFKMGWVFVVFFGVVVPFSRMYLGVHSYNQIFFGFTFGMAWIVMFRYGMRELFYKVFACMLKLKKLRHLFGVIFVHLVLTIIPVIIYKIRSDNAPMAQEDIDNLNRICGSSATSEKIQASMLTLCILHSVAFGFMYGFFALKNEPHNKLYFLGLWTYKDKLSIILHSIAQIFCAGLIPVVVVIGFGSFWIQPYSKFFVFNASLTVGAFLFIWLTEKFERRYGWIIYENQEDQFHQGVINLKTGEQLTEKERAK